VTKRCVGKRLRQLGGSLECRAAYPLKKAVILTSRVRPCAEDYNRGLKLYTECLGTVGCLGGDLIYCMVERRFQRPFGRSKALEVITSGKAGWDRAMQKCERRFLPMGRVDKTDFDYVTIKRSENTPPACETIGETKVSCPMLIREPTRALQG